MNELERFRAMLDRAGVVYEAVDLSAFRKKPRHVTVVHIEAPDISLEYGPDRPNQGYYGFYTEFTFDADGKLLEVAIYE